jgi:hypothetical protein
MRGGAEPFRNVNFESKLFSSHLRSSMRRSLLRPAVTLIDLHFLRRDGVAAIQESGTRTSGLNTDTKSSECLHTQLPKQTRQVQLSGISPSPSGRPGWPALACDRCRPGPWSGPTDPTMLQRRIRSIAPPGWVVGATPSVEVLAGSAEPPPAPTLSYGLKEVLKW